jgi:hypothetical protein
MDREESYTSNNSSLLQDVDWIWLAQGRVQWLAVVTTVIIYSPEGHNHVIWKYAMSKKCFANCDLEYTI